jgi:hypothetical protein
MFMGILVKNKFNYMNIKKLHTSANSIASSVVFGVLLLSKSPTLIIAAFLISLAYWLRFFFKSGITESEAEVKKGDEWKLILFTLAFDILPMAYLVGIVTIFFWRKSIWLPLFGI